MHATAYAFLLHDFNEFLSFQLSISKMRVFNTGSENGQESRQGTQNENIDLTSLFKEEMNGVSHCFYYLILTNTTHKLYWETDEQWWNWETDV